MHVQSFSCFTKFHLLCFERTRCYSTSGDKKNIPTNEMKSDYENGQIM